MGNLKDKKLFIHGGKKAREKPFDYLAPISEEEINAAINVLKTKKLSGFYKDFFGGEKVQEFENKFAEYLGVKYAIAVNSGTSALHIALAATGVGPGDEVITTPFTFTATASSVLMNNAIPIFVDVDPENFCIDPKKIKEAITEKTKVILPVHIYGKIANLDEIKKLIEGTNIKIIEDACQAIGGNYDGKKVGSIGDLGCFSFVETKNIVVGEGGMIVTNNDELAQKCRLIRNHGEAWVKGKPREYLSNLLGYNFRPTEITSAIGIEQLKKLDYFNEIRKQNAYFLQNKLREFEGIAPLTFKEGEFCHIFPILFDEEKVGISRDKFVEILNSEGIPATKGYPHPLYKNPIFSEKIAFGDKNCPYSCNFYGKRIDYKNVFCEVAEKICKNLVCIFPIYYPYNLQDMEDIVTAFEKIYSNINELKEKGNKILAIIPARGGSKSLPRKNILPLNGKPLIAYTIEAALGSKYIDKVIVSTDDLEIAKISEQFGAEVPFIRPEHLATDTAHTYDVMEHAVEFLEKKGYKPNSVVLLQPTSPLRTSKHLDLAIEKFLNNNSNSLISIKECLPCEWLFRKKGEEIFPLINFLTLPLENNVNPFNLERQEFSSKTVSPNGAIYIHKTIILKSIRSHINKDTDYYLMDEKSSLEIDTKIDLEIIEKVMKESNN